MKKIIFTIILFIYNLIFSQDFITNPEFPTETDIIEITFNIQELTRKDLVGYIGTLYTHTGVNTNLGNWQYVIGSWGDNNSQPSLTKVSTDVYKITINNPREFYNLTNLNEHISTLNFVLRSSDGTKQSEDLFISLFEVGLNVKILEPQYLPFYPLSGEEINFVIVSSDADSLKLFVNNQIVASTSEDTLRKTIIAEGSGRQWIKFIAEGNGETFIDSVHFIIRENVTIEELPNGIKTGINYIDANTITLALFAPNKKFVYAIGDFNNWEFDPDSSKSWEFDSKYYFKLTPDSTIYWITLNNLTANQEYRFQYLVDGKLKIADPYSDKILEAEDSFISNDTYPNLIQYPNDKTSFSVSVFQTSQTQFQWEANEYIKPAQEKLIIYEMLIRDFVSTHSYETLIDTLDYLQKLGINAIELMPVNEFEGNESWGYNPSFYFAPDKYYGTKNDLKKFIDECHKRNISVIMDIVLNHMYGRSSFVRLYASGDYGPVTSENPWFNVSSPNPVFSWGYDLNHENITTQELVDRVTKYWLEEYKFDGFRFDFTKGFTNTIGDGSSFDQSRINILKRMADNIWEFDSTAYIILEHFAPDSEEKILTDYGMMVWGNVNYNYNEATMGYNDNSNFGRISYKNHGFTKPNLVGYMESHDEERLMYKNLTYGNVFGDYSIKNLNTALDRIKTAAAFFILIPGPKMIWQFEELGYDYSIDYNGRVGNKPIKWDYLEVEERKNLYKTIAALNYLKQNYETFSTSNFTLSTITSTKKIQLSHESMNAVIIGNFDVTEKTIVPDFQNTGKWFNYFSGDSIEITNTQASITLEPGEFHIYTTVKLPTPEQGILVDIKNEEDKIIPHFELLQNFPNPFNPKTIIQYSIPITEKIITSNVKLVVYDVLGRVVKIFVSQDQKPGNYEVEFNAKELSSGIYYYKLSYGSFSIIKKMVLLK
ncbi:MAG: T9SS type A sorting domain-containing protein [Ignavibacteriae bacterium]|nr:T9SS type A sorting domain-containing protein [Ignavibacteriota bacterium]